jgi:hypothetical protein
MKTKLRRQRSERKFAKVARLPENQWAKNNNIRWRVSDYFTGERRRSYFKNEVDARAFAAALNAEFASVPPKEIYAAWAFVDEWLRHFGGGSLLELGKARILELQQSRPSSSKQTKRFMQMLAAGFDIKTKAIGASNLISKNH